MLPSIKENLAYFNALYDRNRINEEKENVSGTTQHTNRG